MNVGRLCTNKWNTLVIFILVLWATSLPLSTQAEPTGWKCFSCTAQKGDDPCVTDPGKVTNGNPTVGCDMEDGSGFGWCMIVRQEYTAIPGEVVSFTRLCVKTEPAIKDEVISDSESTFYYRTCRSHLCNAGSGLESLGPDYGSGGSGGNNLIVVEPESNSALSTLTSSSNNIMIFAICQCILLTWHILKRP